MKRAKSFHDINDARANLINKHYEHYAKLRKNDIDWDAYIRAIDDVEGLLLEKHGIYSRNYTDSVKSANDASRSSVSSAMLAASIGIGLVANAILGFEKRSAAFVVFGILLLTVSMLWGWLDTNSGRIFSAKWADHWRWAIDKLFAWTDWKDPNDLNTQVREHEKNSNLKMKTGELFSVLQIIFLILGFLMLFLGISDRLDIPTYVLSLF